MPEFINLVGKKFGNWLVKNLHHKTRKQGSYFTCECQICSNIRIINTWELRNQSAKRSVCKCERAINKHLVGTKIGKLTILEEKLKKNKLFCLCRCDCGNKDWVIKASLVRKNHVKICKYCYIPRPRKKVRVIDNDGYVVLNMPFHPNSNKNGRLKEHVYIMSQYLGRPLRKEEFVHHRNSIRSDNRIENLELWTRHHPNGCRADDLYNFCLEYISKYKNYNNPSKFNNINSNWFELER